MPLSQIIHVSSSAVIALWQLMESEDELPVVPAVRLEGIGSAKKRIEKLVARHLIGLVTGDRTSPIVYDDNGKPTLPQWHISISHTHGWVAVALSKQESVGIDIEYESAKVDRVACKFIRKDEQSDTHLHRLINWCAKETVFKLLSEQKLQYFDMKLKPFAPKEKGTTEVVNLKDNTSVVVYYCCTSEYVLTWALA